YFGMLHLGVGRAFTQAAAGRHDGDAEVPGLFWTGLAMVGTLGVLAAIVLALGAPLLAMRILRVPAELEAEAEGAFRMLAIALPFVISHPVLNGALESRYRFGLVVAVSAPASALSYLAPIVILQFHTGLVPVVATLAAVRAAAWLAALGLCLRVTPELRHPRLRRASAGPLLRFGGWVSVSAGVGPLLVYLDRYVLGAAISAAAVAYYATSQEVALRLGALSGAVATVLFPAFSAVRRGAAEGVRALLRRGIDGVFLLVFPVSILLAALGRDLLRVWMGPEFSRHGAPVLALLGVALLVNGFAKVATVLLQGVGRPDRVARTHLLELPVYLPLLGGMVALWGIEGAALAWFLRAAGDAALMLRAASREVRGTRPEMTRALAMAAWTAAAGGIAYALPGLGWRAAAAAVALGVGALLFGRGMAMELPWPRRLAPEQAGAGGEL
ncbi:MAG TPA: oligosaccharide flippase family protein, partial [Longimicrobium sp.]|nr:oligosaccharide flippase family protein [Longimicrobium sp.]